MHWWNGLLLSDRDYFQEESTGDCVKCGNWAENEVPLIIALAFLAVGISILCVVEARRRFLHIQAFCCRNSQQG